MVDLLKDAVMRIHALQDFAAMEFAHLSSVLNKI